MNRSSMRGLLRKRLQDPSVSGEWTDGDLNELLNLGLLHMQTEVLTVDPGAFLSVDTFDQVSGQDQYIKPPGFLYEYELAIADSDQASGWRALDRTSWKATRPRRAGTVVEYASLGRYFFLSPIPSASVDEGLRLAWVYSLSMNADSDVPQLVLPLHDAAVDAALLSALSDTSETEAQDRAEARIARVVEKLPLWYRRSRVPTTLGIEARDARRFSSRRRDIYRS